MHVGELNSCIDGAVRTVFVCAQLAALKGIGRGAVSGVKGGWTAWFGRRRPYACVLTTRYIQFGQQQCRHIEGVGESVS